MSKTYLVNEADLTAIADAIRAKSGTTELLTFPSEMVNVIDTLSTGVELNFEVVGGTTQPENPTENMIWINTDVEITRWMFSADEPSEPIEGTVWIVTGKTSAISFDILEENVLTVYPLMSYQFINGEFVIKDAQIYQSGEWQPVGCYVVQNGVKKVDIQEKGDGHTIEWDQDGWCYMQCVKNGADVTSCVYCYTSEPIDMTDFNSITLNYRALGGNCYKAMGMFLGVCSSTKTPEAWYGGLSNADAQVSASPAALGVDWDLSPYKELGNTGELVLDVSAISGEYRIIWALVNNSIGSSTINRYTKSYIGSIELKG